MASFASDLAVNLLSDFIVGFFGLVDESGDVIRSVKELVRKKKITGAFTQKMLGEFSALPEPLLNGFMHDLREVKRYRGKNPFRNLSTFLSGKIKRDDKQFVSDFLRTFTEDIDNVTERDVEGFCNQSKTYAAWESGEDKARLRGLLYRTVRDELPKMNFELLGGEEKELVSVMKYIAERGLERAQENTRDTVRETVNAAFEEWIPLILSQHGGTFSVREIVSDPLRWSPRKCPNCGSGKVELSADRTEMHCRDCGESYFSYRDFSEIEEIINAKAELLMEHSGQAQRAAVETVCGEIKKSAESMVALREYLDARANDQQSRMQETLKAFEDGTDRLIARISSELERVIKDVMREQYLNARENLYNATHEENTSTEKVLAQVHEVKKYAPDDLLANFYECAHDSDPKKLTAFLKSFNVRTGEAYIGEIVGYLLSAPDAKILDPIKTFVQRAKDTHVLTSGQYDGYMSAIEEEKQKLDRAVYAVWKERDVFLAYSGRDSEIVDEVVADLERDGDISCFTAARNMRHGRGAADNYWKNIQIAIGHCKIVVFISTENSRSLSCEAIGRSNSEPGELPYIQEHFPDMVRIQYFPPKDRGETTDGARDILDKFFEGREDCRSLKDLKRRILSAIRSGSDTVTQAQEYAHPAEAAVIEAEPFVIKGGVLEKYNGKDSVVQIPSGVKEIGPSAFNDCKFLKSVTVPAGVTKIGEWAFSTCTALVQCTLPQSLRSIGDDAFYGCAALGELNLPAGLQSIGEKAFSCSALKRIVIPASVRSVGEMAFSGCDALTQIECGADELPIGWDENWNFDGIPVVWDCFRVGALEAYDKTLFEIEGTILRNYRGEGPVVTIPKGVTAIGTAAFSHCETLETVTIPESVTKIEEQAFWGCRALKAVTLPEGVTKIGFEAFADCRSITALTIPANVTQIIFGAFKAMDSLTKLTVDRRNKVYRSEGNCIIERETDIVVAGCNKSIIPEDVTAIGWSAFSWCRSLKTIKIPASITAIGKSAFLGCEALEHVTIPAGVTVIGEKAFEQCPKLTISCEAEQQPSDWDRKWNPGNRPVVWDCRRTAEEKPLSAPDYPTLENYDKKQFRIEGTILKEYLGRKAVVKIPYGVTEIGGNAFWNHNALAEITIPTSVKSIGRFAFHACISLKEVAIPESITSINEYAFFGCSSLKEIVIPSGVAKIGEGTFNECNALEKITVDRKNNVYRSESNCIIEKKTNTLIAGCNTSVIPVGVTTIGEYAFSCCGLLEKIMIPDGVMSIGEHAFDGCSSLQEIVIPASVKAIERAAFRGCKSLQEVTIPASVTEIGNSVFLGCESLQEVTIPTSVTSIGPQAFACFGQLTIYCEAKEKPADWDEDWNPYNRPVVWDCRKTKAEEEAEARKAAEAAAQEVAEAKPWLAPDYPTLENYDKSLFQINRTILKKYLGVDSIVKIPEGVTTIGRSAFFDCDWIQEITIPASVTKIGAEAFGDCKSLKEITIPASVTTIWEWAFSGCSSLKEITIPASVTSIGQAAFSACDALAKITVEEKNKIYRSENNCLIERKTNTLIAGCNKSIIPASVTSIGECAFWFYSSLKKITIPASVTSIGGSAFLGCSALKEITIPASVTSIGRGAFSTCDALAKITLDEKNKIYRSENNCIIERKKNTLIAGCNKSIIPVGVTSIGDSAFEGCSSLQRITIPAGVTSIGDSAFEGCSSFEKITIPTSVTSIGEKAFWGCSSLKEITIPASVMKIGTQAFACFRQLTIYCEAKEKPADWDEDWNPDFRPVVWNYKKPGLAEGYPTLENYDKRKFRIKGTVLERYSGKETEVQIPRGVTQIGSYKKLFGGETIGAFEGTDVTRVVIPDGVTKIGEKAFHGCRSLENVIVADSVVTIENHAFTWCRALKEIACAGVQTVGDYAFLECASLAGVTVGERTSAIGTGAFRGCGDLRSVYLPVGVQTVGSQAFDGCRVLEIRCAAAQKPASWPADWNPLGRPVTWGAK